MPTQCSADLFGFAPVEGRRVEAGFDGGTITALSPARFCSGRPTASSAWLGALQAASWMRAGRT